MASATELGTAGLQGWRAKVGDAVAKPVSQRTPLDDDHAFADKLHGKYGAGVAAYDQPGDRRVVVTIEPRRIRPVDMSA